ncbi:MAG: hypothetical protein V3U87_16020 [Methylococcaceae bacterium]
MPQWNDIIEKIPLRSNIFILLEKNNKMQISKNKSHRTRDFNNEFLLKSLLVTNYVALIAAFIFFIEAIAK